MGQVESVGVVGNYVYGKEEDGTTLKLEKAGDFVYHFNEWNKIIGMIYICPCGCDGIKMISFGPRSGRTPVWTWNSDIKKPILTPKLYCSKSKWIGYLVRGIFRGVFIQ